MNQSGNFPTVPRMNYGREHVNLHWWVSIFSHGLLLLKSVYFIILVAALVCCQLPVVSKARFRGRRRNFEEGGYIMVSLYIDMYIRNCFVELSSNVSVSFLNYPYLFVFKGNKFIKNR